MAKHKIVLAFQEHFGVSQKGGDLLSETLISSHTRIRIHHEDPASIPSFSKTKRFSLGIELDYVTCFLGNGSGRFGRSPIKRRSCTFWGNTPLPLIQEDDYSGVNMFSVATKYVDPSSSRNSPTAGDKKHYTQLAGGDSLMGGGFACNSDVLQLNEGAFPIHQGVY